MLSTRSLKLSKYFFSAEFANVTCYMKSTKNIHNYKPITHLLFNSRFIRLPSAQFPKLSKQACSQNIFKHAACIANTVNDFNFRINRKQILLLGYDQTGSFRLGHFRLSLAGSAANLSARPPKKLF